MTDLSARLEAAALSLTGPGPIKERLTDAYCSHLEDLQASDLSALGDEFAEMIQALHRERALPGDNVVRASVRKLSNQDVRHYAELVVRALWHARRRAASAQQCAHSADSGTEISGGGRSESLIELELDRIPARGVLVPAPGA